MQTGQEIDRNESSDLISAAKVKGTDVYDASGDRIGEIDDVMITKRSGEIAYAVMSFGGFLGIGEKFHPLPWDALEYDTSLGGYRVGAAGENFRNAPSYSRDEVSRGGWDESTDDYYDEAGRDGGWLSRRSGNDGARSGLSQGTMGGTAAGGLSGSAGSSGIGGSSGYGNGSNGGTTSSEGTGAMKSDTATGSRDVADRTTLASGQSGSGQSANGWGRRDI